MNIPEERDLAHEADMRKLRKEQLKADIDDDDISAGYWPNDFDDDYEWGNTVDDDVEF